MVPALIVIGILFILYLLFFLENRRFVVTRSEIRHSKIDFTGTIVQVSDLHDLSFGKEQKRLLDAIRAAQPDQILITGDLFNRRNKNAFRNAFTFVRGAKKIAPVYFAEGNHECSLGETGERDIETIRQMGVVVLRDEYTDLPHYRLIGLKQYASPQQLRAMIDPERLNIVLAHRPELFPIYAGEHPDIVLSGHAHGGQIRAFRFGLYAPGQGFFPRFTAGQHWIGNTCLYVSRGLGNTIPFPRVFNTPELNVISLQPIEQKGEEKCL